MKNLAMQAKLQEEIIGFIRSRYTLQLATRSVSGDPYASYAPFALGDECFYVLLSEIAIHGVNLQTYSSASVLLIEDEDSARERFARVRLNYQVGATLLKPESPGWQQGIGLLEARHGDRVGRLAMLDDFKLFRLQPQSGRYVKDFGKAYALKGESLCGAELEHLREGHRKREVA